MPDTTIGAGEQAEATRRKRLFRTFAALFTGGLVVGLVLGLVEGQAPIRSGGTIPPELAVALAVAMVAICGWGCLAYSKVTDEFRKQASLFAGAMGANAMILGYPVWAILWKGGLLPEPDHIALFLAVLLVTMGTYLWRIR